MLNGVYDVEDETADDAVLVCDVDRHMSEFV